MKRATPLLILACLLAVAIGSDSAQAAPARDIQIPPFDWSTASWDPTNGGYCDGQGVCADPRNLIPATFGQYCATDWCSYPSWNLGFQLGLYGGIGTGGGACDYSTDCYVPTTAVQPPSATACPPAWPICSVLYPSSPTPVPPLPPVPTPTSGECPLNLRVSQPAPTLSVSPLAPAHPIVVGQDPNKRGVDVSASIQIHPVIVKYDVPKYEHECQFVGGTVTDSACQNNPGWKNQKVFAGCETKTESYIDRIAFATIEANLAPDSIRWITTELAAKYPGAHVYQAHWSLWPGRAPSQGGLSADGANLSVIYAQLPLADPGQYRVLIQGTTRGTPYTAPRSFSHPFPDLVVHLLESTIIK